MRGEFGKLKSDDRKPFEALEKELEKNTAALATATSAFASPIEIEVE